MIPSRTLWRRPSKSILSRKPGVFALPGLHSAADWQQVAIDCTRVCERLAKEIRNYESNRDVNLLRKFDELSNSLCIVLDTAELCRNVHPDPEFCNAAEDAYFSVSAMVQNLNADYQLYKPLAELHEAVCNQHPSVAQFTEEDIHMTKSLTLDFEKGGICLPVDKKNRLIKLQETVNRLSSQFIASTNASPSAVAIPNDLLRFIPRPVHRLLKRDRNTGNHVLTPSSGAIIHSLIGTVPNSDLRLVLYRAINNFHSEKGLGVLDDILKARHQLAHILGKSSYADMQFEGRLASSPKDVERFLYNLCSITSPLARKELSSLHRISGSYAALDPGQLHAWDRPFYISQAKTSLFDSLRDMSQFLPLRACVNGIAMVMKETFGVIMENDTVAYRELWHPSVTKMRLSNENGELLGHIYLDLVPRPGKSVHAAHYCIRCGRSPCTTEPYQTPTVALVCNFSRSSPSGEQLLSFGEYETLWHEMGHAMHSILSRTTYQHLSGTRVSTDSVEIPSHLFEYFSSDPRVLGRIAKHHQTNEPMPTRMISAFCSARTSFAAIDLQTQALYAVMDLVFHGERPPIGDTTRTFHKLHDAMTVFAHDPYTAAHASFQHIVGYGAGYYSYIFARIISAHVWTALFESDPFSREAGHIIRTKLLSKGASKTPFDLIHDVLQTAPSCAPFLRMNGISDFHCDLNLPLTKTKF